MTDPIYEQLGKRIPNLYCLISEDIFVLVSPSLVAVNFHAGRESLVQTDPMALLHIEAKDTGMLLLHSLTMTQQFHL